MPDAHPFAGGTEGYMLHPLKLSDATTYPLTEVRDSLSFTPWCTCTLPPAAGLIIIGYMATAWLLPKPYKRLARYFKLNMNAPPPHYLRVCVNTWREVHFHIIRRSILDPYLLTYSEKNMHFYFSSWRPIFSILRKFVLFEEHVTSDIIAKDMWPLR